MKIVVAPDSFKGSLSALDICNIAEKVAKRNFIDCDVIKLPLADGGEGTVDCLVSSLNAREVSCLVKDPLGRLIESKYAIFDDNAVMEMATASGLPLVKTSERDIFKHSTFGTGEMILDAIEKGCKHIYIGIGGSATNDGGIGFAAALGVKFLNSDGDILEPIAKNFTEIDSIDLTDIDTRIKDTEITVMSDVKNPLLGETGATYVFGKQKGADETTQPMLENGMKHYIDVVEKAVSKSVRDTEGAGAAGGLGAGLMAFTNAEMRSGIETILEILDFKNKCKDAELVITGEGMMDYQSAFGKVASGVGKICKEQDIPCVAIVGSMGKDAIAMFDYGITSIIPTVNGVMSLENALNNAEELTENACERMFRLVKIGLK